jgi:peptidoglycan-associated lipoprotein
LEDHGCHGNLDRRDRHRECLRNAERHPHRFDYLSSGRARPRRFHRCDRTSTGENIDENVFEQNVKPAFFDYDAYEIRPDAQTVLAQDASYLAAHPTLKVVIGGYCDDRGSAEYNLALGENRANAAKQALVNGGIAPDRIRTVSYGKEKQFCTQAVEACWQQNRRAGFSLDR